MKPDLSVEIAGIKMKNPVMPASGTFGYGEDASQFVDISKLGAVIVKTTTLEPRQGNPPPRIGETDAGMINSIGLQNPGVEVVIKEKIPFLKEFGIPIIASIAGRTSDEYKKMAQRLDKVKELAGLEVNVSCPNVGTGGVAFGQNPDITSKLVFELKSVTSLPLIIKLTPNVTDIVLIGRSAVEAGADALSLINTLKARVKLRGKDACWLEGGLSGPAVKPIALRMVSDLAKANLGVPIIGIGGIQTVTDVVDFLESGADAIQIGTANFVNPNVMMEVIDGLKKYMVKKKYINITELKKGEKDGSKR